MSDLSVMFFFFEKKNVFKHILEIPDQASAFHKKGKVIMYRQMHWLIPKSVSEYAFKTH